MTNYISDWRSAAYLRETNRLEQGTPSDEGGLGLGGFFVCRSGAARRQ
ncbi:hypothetical protein ACFO9Q_03835 [Paenibacillus sp. GCM10023252]